MADALLTENASSYVPISKKLSSKGKDKVARVPFSESSVNAERINDRTIEQIYQKKSQLEHILLRPDTYIGSVETRTQALWVYNEENPDKFVNKVINYVPGLFKIFDEIVVNAADNFRRDPTMNKFEVVIDEVKGSIKVWNNGSGIPVELHKEEGVYVPELVFGHLLTSSNYNDNEKKITGGRNGFGAKLTNIFSKEFIIETADGSRGQKYRQVFRNNMQDKSKPEIKPCKAKDNWTCLTFTPDFEKFGMTDLDPDIIALMKKRAYDVAGCLGKQVKCYLNGELIKVKSFQDYCSMYLTDDTVSRVYEKISDRWEVLITSSDGQFQQVSFVNSINTIKGGTHVGCLADQIVQKILPIISKRVKGHTLKPFQLKNQMWIFVNCLIENPAFDSQCKETLNTLASKFGSKPQLSDDFLKKVSKSAIVDRIIDFASVKQAAELKKTDGAKRSKLSGIPKLDDANHAGGRSSKDCTLILTEGDSAKALAVSGLSVVGRDKYGVFPLRGKLLNVREGSHDQIKNNVEINNIKQILGLQQSKVYNDTSSLRYGHLMIMTDQDHDGSHIKGLVINFVSTFWPSLLKCPNFIQEFATPIVKAKKGRETKTFYSIPQYEEWKESLGGSSKGWTIKYYKGLGTSTAAEAKEYFGNLDQHTKTFVWNDREDDEVIDLAFSKKRADDRKKWLIDYDTSNFRDHSDDSISYSDFINKDLILFSRADLQRSIPSMVDGLKAGQRKILFCAFKRKLKSDIKVAQLAGYVSEHSAYHHGEQSLASTIVGLAQSYVGSNNINLLAPSGQFGTRLQGGKDCASSRYIFTRLLPITRKLFPEADDSLLNYLNEDGQSIEPEWYVPIIPMVLVNGADGIGTGWSTSIPNYNPRSIVENIRRYLRGDEMVSMCPWYKGFTGTISEVWKKDTFSGSYNVVGTARQIDDCTVEITELPIRKWTQDYKEFLEECINGKAKAGCPTIKEYREYHTDETVHFQVVMTPESLEAAKLAGLEKSLKLTSTISITNMHLWDKDNRIRHYNSPEEILTEFCELRLQFYEERKATMISQYSRDLLLLENKVRFIKDVCAGTLKVSNRKKADIMAELERKGYTQMEDSNRAAKPTDGDEDSDVEEDSDRATDVETNRSLSSKSYDYLLSMQIWSLTFEKVEQLNTEKNRKAEDLAVLRNTSPKEMWERDLDDFEAAFGDLVEQEAKSKAAAVMKAKSNDTKAKKKVSNKEKTISKASTKSAKAGKSDSSRSVPSTSAPKIDQFFSKEKADAIDSAPKSLMERLAERKRAVQNRPDSTASVSEVVVDNSLGGDNKAGKTAKPQIRGVSQGLTSSRGSTRMAPRKTTSSLCTSSKSNSSSETARDNNEVTSPPLAQEKKVRKFRPSPFHKGSGAGGLTESPKVTTGVSSNPTVARVTRPQRQGGSKPKSYADYYSEDEVDDSDDEDFHSDEDFE